MSFVTEAVKNAISSSLSNVDQVLKINKAAVMSNVKSYKPVYKIAVTYPIEEGTGSLKTIKAKTRIIADTSNGFRRALGLPISDLNGMWIDTDDVGEPDKAVMLFRVDPEYTTRTVTGQLEGNVTDDILAFNRYFSNRNWIDVWVGYENIVTGDQEPSDFNWYNETHLFSGPIVMVRRKFSKHGDQLSVVALSSEMIFKFAKLRTRGIFESNNSLTYSDSLNNKKRPISEIFELLFNSLMSESEWGRIKNDESIERTYAFVIGDFYWGLVKDGIAKIKKLFAKKTNYDDLRFQERYPPVDRFINNMLFDGTIRMQSSFTANGNVDFWSVLLTLLQPLYSGAVGVGFRVIKNVELRGNLPTSVELENHPGVYFQFFLTMDVEEVIELWNKKKKRNAYSVVMENELQAVILGQDVIDLETFIDYSSVFNSFRVLARSSFTKKNEDPLYQEGLDTSFPQDLDLTLLDWWKTKDKAQLWKFWSDVLRDIKIFGEQQFPIPKWFTTSIEEMENERKNFDLVDPALRKSLEGASAFAIAGHIGIAGIFKRYYYAGLEGTSYCIGNPSLKTNRFVQIKDVRNAFSNAMRGTSTFGSSIEGIIGKISTSGVANKLVAKDPLEIRTNFGDAVNQFFYIWKVRHYLGPKSGYLTKVYFMKSRSRSWRKHTGDTISDIIRQAMRSAQEQFGA